MAALVAAALACASAPKPGSGPGLWHVVQPGENLWRISRRYDASLDTVKRSNGIRDVRGLQVGQRLWIPGGRRPKATGGSGAPVARRPTPPIRKTRPRPEPATCRAQPADAAVAFAWPLRGRVTSRFGPRRGRRHDGIDIAADSGTKIRAADAGRVIHSGGGLGDYGNVVIVKHAGNWATVYAHNKRNLVRKGAFVDKGQVIAEVGRSGNATGPHLHFEIRRRNQAHDPLSCLP
ncbi:MAG: M23 family metallopeptidase [Myxococcota bacterium]|nr:M23 family metallopeptidase [Myxococcota bacterium]